MGSFVGPKRIMHALVLLFLLRTSSLVWAVDITFYESTSGCHGVGYSCYGVDTSTCCVTDSLSGGSVSVTTNYGAGCLGAKYYEYGDCRRGTYLDTTYGNFCYYGGGFTAAYWFNTCRRRSLLSERESKTPACTGQTKPNAVVFTEDGTKGHWILTSSNVNELYSQLKNVNDAEKLDWIKSKGASYKELDANLQLEIKQHE